MKLVGVPFVHSIGSNKCDDAVDKIFGEVGVNGFEHIALEGVDVEEANNLIHKKAAQIFDFEDDSVFVGGDQSITYPIFSAFSEKNKNAWLVVFDAHADCEESSRNPTNEEWLRTLIEDGFDPKRIILVGTRRVWGNEKAYVQNSGMKVFSEIGDLEAVGDYITEKINGKPVYVSFDIDSLDPAFAPGTKAIEPDGLTSGEFFYLSRRIFKCKGLKTMDVCEVNPGIDKKYDYRTVKLAARLIQEFIGERNG